MIRLRRVLSATAVCAVALSVMAGSALADKPVAGPPGSSAANPIVLSGQTVTVTQTQTFSDPPNKPAPGGGPSPFTSFGGGNCTETYALGHNGYTIETYIIVNCTPGVHNVAGTAQLWRGGVTTASQFLASDTEVFGANGGIWGMSAGCYPNQTWAYHTNINYTLISQDGYGHNLVGYSPYVYIRC